MPQGTAGAPGGTCAMTHDMDCFHPPAKPSPKSEDLGSSSIKTSSCLSWGVRDIPWEPVSHKHWGLSIHHVCRDAVVCSLRFPQSQCLGAHLTQLLNHCRLEMAAHTPAFIPDAKPQLSRPTCT